MEERFLVLYRGSIDDLPLLLAADYPAAAAMAKAVAAHPDPCHHPAVAAVCDLMRLNASVFVNATVLRFRNGAPAGVAATFDAANLCPAELGGKG